MNESYPEPVRQFMEALQTLYPKIEITIESGGRSSGAWWMDVSAESGYFVVKWSPAQGFALEQVDDGQSVYGSAPAERYQTVDLALRRMTQVLAMESAAEIGGVALRDLRELHKLSQSELGTRLGIKQAAVSRVERRTDLHLDTLAAIVKALGGTLEVRARFPDCDVPLTFASA